MNKNFDLKNDPQYNQTHLRRRITDGIKRLRDDTEELYLPVSKTMPIIPVTGHGKTLKYFNNKSKTEF